MSASHNFGLTVTPNHAPVCDDPFTAHTKVNEVLSLFFFCSDEDAQDQDSLAYTVISPPAHGSVGTITNGQADYTPNSGSSGADSFTVRASDGSLHDDFVQNVHVANTPFCDTPAPATIRSGQSRSLEVDCTFPDDDFGTHTYEVVGAGPAKGSLNPPAGTSFSFRTYTADAGASGSDSYSVRVTSTGTGGSGNSPAVTQQITTGSAANNAPNCQNTGTESVYAGHAQSLFTFCTDLDHDPLTYSVGSPPAHGTSSIVANHLRYTANGGYTGPDSVPFSVSDGHGGTTPGHVDVDVLAPEVPTCFQGPITLTMRPGSSTDLQLDCFDPQGDDETYSVVAGDGPDPAKGSLGGFDSSGGVTYTATSGATGQDTFSLKASNPVGNSTNQQVTITFDPTFNRAPQCFQNFNPRKVAAGATTP